MTGFRPQQQPQMPANQQQNVPDHRIDDVMKQLQELKLQNAQLRGTIDYMKQPQQGPPQNQDPAFKPEVQQAIDARVKQMLEPLQTQFRQQVGYLADQLDEARYMQNYGGEKYKPFQSKVEQIRQQALAENRYITREQALQLAYFEEGKGKNPQPDPQAQQPQQPVFDPFFQTYVDPVTRKPIMQNQTGEAPQEAPEMQAPQWQQEQQPQQQQQPQFGMQQPGAGQRGVHPNGNAFGQQPQQFNLPQQGMNPQAPSYQARDARQPLDLGASDADLQAFEDNFGDIPL